MDFNVNTGKSITVTQLGVFAAAQNATPFRLANSHTVYIYQRTDSNNTGTVLTKLTLSAASWNAAPLTADGYRFVSLPTPLTLAAGTYSVVAESFGTDKYYNEFSAPSHPAGSNAGDMNIGCGAISFVDLSRFGSTGNYPTTGDNYRFQYGAGSFDYTVNTVPAVGRIPGDVVVNGNTAVLDLGNNQTGYVATVTLDGG